MDKINIRLIIGLGNPGPDYKNTRHNMGFLFIDKLAESLEATDFEYKKKLDSEIAEINYKLKATSHKLILVKPQTFMNKSGEAVSTAVKFYKVRSENILVIHDDIDIPWGNFKLSFGRLSAGHKGVESIIKSLKTKNFWRLRIGIQPRTATRDKKQETRIKAEKVILKKFTPAEEKDLKQTIKRAISELE